MTLVTNMLYHNLRTLTKYKFIQNETYINRFIFRNIFIFNNIFVTKINIFVFNAIATYIYFIIF